MISAATLVFLAALALFSLTVFRSIGLGTIFNPDALMIVAGGTTIALFLGFPAPRLKKTIEVVIESFRPLRDRQELAKEMLELARASHKADIRGLEKRTMAMKDEFLRLGMNLLISHRTSRDIRSIMNRELSLRMMDFQFSQNVLKAVARLTPSFGLAGTVISLIKIFRTTQSIDEVAPLMAVAMMSTFYGVIISNLFMLPLCAKLEERAVQSEAVMQAVVEGIEAMNDWQNPLRVEERISGNYGGEAPRPVKRGPDPAAIQTPPVIHTA
ncbi:MAG TPA: MotA/TolQ/ExbB proton channel family protein [Nitrospirota bacterium]|nr:MotA/TolQ/ExbB proton channel family protein [Nitrospirota bacterium]